MMNLGILGGFPSPGHESGQTRAEQQEGTGNFGRRACRFPGPGKSCTSPTADHHHGPDNEREQVPTEFSPLKLGKVRTGWKVPSAGIDGSGEAAKSAIVMAARRLSEESENVERPGAKWRAKPTQVASGLKRRKVISSVKLSPSPDLEHSLELTSSSHLETSNLTVTLLIVPVPMVISRG